MSEAPPLGFREVALVMGDSRVLDDVSFELRAGETLAIVGASGSGKTRIARLAAGLDRPTSGRVSLFGQDAYGRSPPRRTLGVTLQGGSLFDGLSVDDNLRLGSGITSTAGWRALSARVDRLLYEFGLDDLADVRAGALPIGAKRQLEVVRALLRDPALLILDEPFEGATAGLADLAGTIRRSMRRRGGAILLVTEDAELATTLTERQVTLDHGRLQQDDAVSRPAAMSSATASASADTPA